MADFAILLAPSTEKKVGGNPFAPDMFDYRTSNTFNYFHELNPERRQLISVLLDFIEAGEGLEAVLGLEGEDLAAAAGVDREIFHAPLMSALDRYSPGVVYSAMTFHSLPTGAQRRLLENGIIFSGLFGLLRPDDLIPNYHLGMDASVPGIGPVAEFWRQSASRLLNQRLTGKIVWNLLPEVHRTAWEDDHSYREMVDVSFVTESKGVRTPVDLGSSPLVGQFVNYVVREAAEMLEPARSWSHPEGFRFDASSEEYDEEKKRRRIEFVKR